MYSYIKRFDEIGKSDIEIVGGKGANLGEMTGFGLPVPPGFCVVSGAYVEFINVNELDEVIKLLMEGLDEEDSDALQNTSESIKKKIIESSFPKKMEEEIVSAYEEFSKKIGLKNPEVAVRSSATAEDLPEASFAGQQDTYLHISGKEALLDHIRRCFASLWTARAIYYRVKQDFDHFKVSLSVVVQKMIDSEKSGVMFTANPINHNVEEIMINASWGLGEAVVSGMASPDEYIFSKKEGKVIEKHIAEKKVMVVKSKSGQGTEDLKVKDVLGKEFIKKQCLTDDEIQKLAEFGMKIEKAYGSNQDIEWAFDHDLKDLFILQSRPITTLKKEEVEVSTGKKLT
ncbi:MAG: phosphoenolpyruvate synthase, partial [Tissierellia bacterium]|nr:phosphoenolpyruvate synthase [Tissierellia bacterium]